MDVNHMKEGMILKESIHIASENIVIDKGTVLSLEQISFLKQSDLRDIDVIHLSEKNSLYEQQMYQAYIKLSFCFSNHINNEQMLNLMRELKNFMYEYLDNIGGNASDE
ncbi:hypothetical protein J7L67_02555 [bacterium]|nr:hypothetical protein [bacterium]